MWDSIRFAARSIAQRRQEWNQLDAFRFAMSANAGIVPRSTAMLEFDVAENTLESPHPDRRLQRMAECFLDPILKSGKRRSAADAAS